MKFVSYREGATIGFGALKRGGVVALAGRTDPKIRTLGDGLRAGALDRLRAVAEREAPDIALADVSLLPPVTDPGKIICVGLNYAPHVKETGREMPAYPALFPRYPQSLIGHGATLKRPRISTQFDFEGEFAFIVGKAGRKIAPEEAPTHIAGYTCLMDGSIRDWQRHTPQFLPGKNFRESGAMGPWLVTSDEIPDPTALEVVTRLNGKEMQRGRVSDLIFPVADLVAYISTFIDLEPGDVVSTGTPGGVGHARKPPVYMKAGDRIAVEIGGIGTLENPVADEA